MEDEKTKLREALFTFYFEETEDRMPITSLLKQIEPVVEVWEGLRAILETNIKEFDFFSRLDLVKIINYQEKNYLFIKEKMQSYLIVDLKTKQVLAENDVATLFDEKFFVQNLGEYKTDLNEKWLHWYHFLECNQNIDKIIDYCLANENVLKLPNYIVCNYKIGDALTYLSIGLANKSIHLGFQTPDQFLYEHLYFALDLTPWGMQDAHESMGIEKMKEMFVKIKEVKIPISCVPKEFLNEEIRNQTRKLERDNKKR